MRVKCSGFEEMAEEIKLGHKKIVMFGAGVIGTLTAPAILDAYHLGELVDCYVDNDKRKWGKTAVTPYGKKIIHSPQYLQSMGDNMVILLNVSRYMDLLKQLEQMECLKNVLCYIIPMMCVINFHRDGGQGVIRESENPLIPKVIHYMWLGGRDMPENLLRCIDSWRKYCPDYEIVCWNESNYDISKYPYMKQAYENHMFAFVTDYARLDLLFQYGGIYMDTDVEVIKPLDELLYQQAFCGVEKWQVLNFGGCSGAVKGHAAIGEVLKARENVFFVENDGSLNTTTCGLYDTRVMIGHGYRLNNTNQRILDMNIYTYDYFQPYDYMSKRMEITSDTHTIHHFNGGWLDEKMKSANEKTAREFEELYKKCR